MIMMGIVAGAGVCYWFEWHGLAFWFLVYSIVYGGLSAVRATVKPNGYIKVRQRPEHSRTT